MAINALLRRLMIGRIVSKSASKVMSLSWPTRAMSSTSIQRIGVDDPRMSRIVVNNGVVYISGQTDATGNTIEDQAKNVLDKVDKLLEEAGTNKSKLLTSSIWLKDIENDFHGFNSVWIKWLDPHNKPVRATVESPMARPILLIEVQVTAALDD